MVKWGKYQSILLLCLTSTLISNGQNDTLRTFEKLSYLHSSSGVIVYINPYLSSQISDSVLQQWQSGSLAELLRNGAGLYIKSYGSGGVATVSVRGNGANHTQLLWNGIAINSPTLGMQDLSLLPVSFVDEVEIHQGAGGSISSSGRPGGSVGFGTNASFEKRINLTYQNEFGSFGNRITIAKGKYGTGKWQGRSGYYTSNSDNNFTFSDYSKPGDPIAERENAQTKIQGFSQDFSVQLNRHRIDIKSNYVHADRQIPGAIGTGNSSAVQMDESWKNILSWKLDQKNTKHEVKTAYILDEQFYEDSATSIAAEFKTQTSVLEYLLSQRLGGGFSTDFQTNYYRYNVISSGFAAEKTQNRFAFFGSLEKKIRNQDYSFSIREEIIDGAPTIPVFALAGSYILGYRTYRSNTIKANLSSHFQYPSLNDLYWKIGGNEALQPEQGYTAEIQWNSIFWRHFKKGFSLKGYYSQTNDWIQWLPTELGYWSPNNIKTVEKTGFEAQLQLSKLVIRTGKKERKNIPKSTQPITAPILYAFTGSDPVKVSQGISINFNANYSYTHAITKASNITNDVSVGKQLLYVPKHVLNIQTTLGWKKWVFNYNQTITGKTYIDTDNRTYLPYTAPASVDINYVIKDKNVTAQMGLKVQNLFNETYQVIANQPMPGRYIGFVFKLGLNHRYNGKGTR